MAISIDYRIGKTPPRPYTMAQYGQQVATLAQMQGQNQDDQIRRERELKDYEALQMINKNNSSQNGFNYLGAEKQAEQIGRPDLAKMYSERSAEIEKQRADMQNALRDQRIKELKAVVGYFKTDSGRIDPATYSDRRNKLIMSGLASQENIPLEYDPEHINAAEKALAELESQKRMSVYEMQSDDNEKAKPVAMKMIGDMRSGKIPNKFSPFQLSSFENMVQNGKLGALGFIDAYAGGNLEAEAAVKKEEAMLTPRVKTAASVESARTTAQIEAEKGKKPISSTSAEALENYWSSSQAADVMIKGIDSGKYNVTSRLFWTSLNNPEIESARLEFLDILSRTRTGAAMTESEEKFYNKVTANPAYLATSEGRTALKNYLIARRAANFATGEKVTGDKNWYKTYEQSLNEQKNNYITKKPKTFEELWGEE